MNKSVLTAIILSLSLAFLLAGCGSKPDTPPDPTTKPADDPKVAAGDSSILAQIPAGSSYIMTGSVEKTIGSAEMFLIDIGVGQMLNIGVSSPGDGRGPQNALLDMIKMASPGSGIGTSSGIHFVKSGTP